jgi:hypothetical protein
MKSDFELYELRTAYSQSWKLSNHYVTSTVYFALVLRELNGVLRASANWWKQNTQIPTRVIQTHECAYK